MADDEIEWLDEPATPAAAPEGMRARRPRRPVLLIVGALAIVAIVGGVVLASRGDHAAAPTPKAVVTVVTSSPSGNWTSTVDFPEATPGLLRAVAERFRGAELTSTGACVSDGDGSYGFTARGVTIQLDVGCGATDQDTDIRGPHQIVVNGPRARVSVVSSPNRTLTERDFGAAERLIGDKRIVS